MINKLMELLGESMVYLFTALVVLLLCGGVIWSIQWIAGMVGIV